VRRFVFYGLALIIIFAGCSHKGSKSTPADAGGDLSISPVELPVAMPNALYTAQLIASDGTPPYTWSITSGSPPGTVDVNPSTGELSGIPDAPGSYSFTVTVEDSSTPALSGWRRYTLVVTDGGYGWERKSADAVLTEGASGDWDAGGVGMPCVIKDGDTYKMWFSASDTTPSDYYDFLNSNTAIGYATSTDGINWTKHSGNPVLAPTGNQDDPDGSFVGAACVIKESSEFKMWYTGASSTDFSGYTYVVPNICYATSTDGIDWTRRGAVIKGAVDIEVLSILPPLFEISGEVYFAPWVVYDTATSTYKMWFSYAGLKGQFSSMDELEQLMQNTKTYIGYATSTDGMDWTVVSKTVLSPKEAWESKGLSFCSVLQDADEGYLKIWFTGTSGDGVSAIGFAKSTNGTSWGKSLDNPVFTPAASGWDAGSVGAPCVIKETERYKMWYTGSSGNTLLGRIGYAENPPSP